MRMKPASSCQRLLSSSTCSTSAFSRFVLNHLDGDLTDRFPSTAFERRAEISDDPKDLKRKAARKGGTHVLITGTGVLGGGDPLVNPFYGDRAVMTGMVFACPAGYAPA